MLAQSMRASVRYLQSSIDPPLTVLQRSLLARAARQQSIALSRRTIMTPTAIRSAELVQDLYLRELKAYKMYAFASQCMSRGTC